MRSIRIWFNKKDSAKYISHLDLTRCIIRAFRRTDIPLWYTEGFNPHPHLVFGLPLALGVEGLRETLDIRLNDDNYPNDRVLSELNRVTVPGIEFLEINEPVAKPLSIVFADYTVVIPDIDNCDDFIKKINDVINSGEVVFEKKTKKGGFKAINACEHLADFVCNAENNAVKMSFRLPAGNDFTVNPVLFCKVLFEKIGEPDILHRIVRHRLLTKDLTEFR